MGYFEMQCVTVISMDNPAAWVDWWRSQAHEPISSRGCKPVTKLSPKTADFTKGLKAPEASASLTAKHPHHSSQWPVHPCGEVQKVWGTSRTKDSIENGSVGQLPFPRMISEN